MTLKLQAEAGTIKESARKNRIFEIKFALIYNEKGKYKHFANARKVQYLNFFLEFLYIITTLVMSK